VKVLWLSWKDRNHPEAGGAETVSGEIMDHLVQDGHEVTLLTARYPGSTAEETSNGITIHRSGNRFSVYLEAKKRYARDFQGWPDIIIDEMNTIPFASGFYSKEKNLLLCYQLAREVWLHQMVAPVSWVGYLSEPFMLRALAKRYRVSATESKSTQKDMERYGFKNVHTFRVGMALQPLTSLGTKTKSNMVLSLGSVRPMKRTLHAVMAFEVARDKDPQLRLVLAGDTSTPYAKKVTEYMQNSRHQEAIEVLGRIPAQRRLELMREADVIVVSSLKEGWGLIVTEANSQGTPAIGYDTDGLRDSIQDGVTGLLCPDGDYTAMGDRIIEMLADTERYASMRTAAWQWSKEFTFENSYQDFLEIMTRAASSTSDK
jgi:glycosyltransferase involved in cell wall biosynthesis